MISFGGQTMTPKVAREVAAELVRLSDAAPCPPWLAGFLAEIGTHVDLRDGSALDLTEDQALAAWRAGVGLAVRR